MVPRLGFLDCSESAIGISVTSAGTILQLGNRVQNCRRVHFLVRIGLELACMAGCAIRFVGGGFVGDCLVVGGMAACAHDRTVVRLVHGRNVCVGGGGFPCGSAVAGIARARGNEVCRSLA